MKTLEETRTRLAGYAANPLGDNRTVDKIDEGQYVRQGDVYIVRIGKAPKGAEKSNERQLAPGVTQGSRHTVGDEVTVMRRKDHGQIERGVTKDKAWARSIGHVIECPERFTVSHPEHSDMSLPAGCYQVYGQVDAATGQRTAD